MKQHRSNRERCENENHRVYRLSCVMKINSQLETLQVEKS